jgi:hypothetical protein
VQGRGPVSRRLEQVSYRAFAKAESEDTPWPRKLPGRLLSLMLAADMQGRTFRSGGAAVRITDQGSKTYAKGRILLSSAGRRWRGISAELRSHPAGERPATVLSVTEIAVMVRGAAVVTRQAEGVRQHIVTSSGTIGLSPSSVREGYKRVETDIDEMLHIYLSPSPFAALAKHTSASFDAASVRYDAGFRDPLIEQIARRPATSSSTRSSPIGLISKPTTPCPM